jgi:hypothetical protein
MSTYTQPKLDKITGTEEDYGNLTRRSLRSDRTACTPTDKHIHAEANKFGSEWGEWS